MGQLNKTTLRVRDSLSRMNTAFAAIGGAFTGRAAFQLVDAFIEAEQRMSIFLGDAERAAEAVDELSEAAMRSYSSFEQVSTVFTRLLIMGGQLNATYDDMRELTESVAASFILSGSTVMEATNAARQLAQGLGSGTLQGEELRAILEQNALLAQSIAKEFGVGVGQLRLMAAEGKLGSQRVFEAILKDSEKFGAMMEDFIPSFRQAMAILGTGFGKYLHDLNKALELNVKFANLVELIVNNIEKIGLVLGGLGATAFGAGVIKALKFIAKFAIKNPLVTMITAAVTAWGYFDDDVSNTFAKLDVYTEMIDVMFLQSLNKVRGKLRELAMKPGDLIFGTPEEIAEGGRLLENYLDTLYVKLGKLNREREKMGDGAGDGGLADWWNEQIAGMKSPPGDNKAAEKAAEDWAALKASLDPINAAMAEYYQNLALINEQTQLGANLQAEYRDRAKEAMLEATGLREVMDGLDPTAVHVRRIEALEQMLDMEEFKDYSDAIQEMIMNTHDEMTKAIEGTAENQKSLIMEVSTFISDQAGRMADSFVQFATDSEFAVSDMVEAMLKDLARLVIFQTITQPLANAVAGGVSNLNFGGGAEIEDRGTSYQTNRALGGPVSPQLAYRVGERGPETFVPNVAGRIIKNGAGGTNVQVINNTSSEATTETTRQPDGSELIRVIVGEVAKDINSNGQIGQSIQSQFGSRIQGVLR